MSTKGLGAGLLAIACAGCGGTLETSLEVAKVEANRDAFAQVEDHPLLGVPAGTVIDDLAALEGCWGAHATTEYIGPVEDYEFYRFDLDEGELTYQALQRAIPFDVVGEWIYSLEMTGPDRITIQLESNFRDSSARDFVESMGTHSVEEAEPFDLQITLDGDAFKIGDSEGASPDFSRSHRANLVFFRFDCPESDDGS